MEGGGSCLKKTTCVSFENTDLYLKNRVSTHLYDLSLRFDILGHQLLQETTLNNEEKKFVSSVKKKSGGLIFFSFVCCSLFPSLERNSQKSNSKKKQNQNGFLVRTSVMILSSILGMGFFSFYTEIVLLSCII